MRYWVAPSRGHHEFLTSRRPELSSRGPAAREVPMRDMINRMMTSGLCALLAVHGMAALRAQERTARDTMPPQAHISNGQIKATLYLPDPERGFYRSTRFDWSGVIASLEYNGHQDHGPWFTGSDPFRARFRLPRCRHPRQCAERGRRSRRGIPAPAGIRHGETRRDVRQDWRRRAAQAR